MDGRTRKLQRRARKRRDRWMKRWTWWKRVACTWPYCSQRPHFSLDHQLIVEDLSCTMQMTVFSNKKFKLRRA